MAHCGVHETVVQEAGVRYLRMVFRYSPYLVVAGVERMAPVELDLAVETQTQQAVVMRLAPPVAALVACSFSAAKLQAAHSAVSTV